ncbi:MAG: ABC transporter permease [Kiritimatiellales bacterium]|nr:ABC transporter permease [Kiritimatiellales bacterium]
MHKNFDFIFELTKARFKLRNEGSFLGVFWYLLGPLLTFIILLLVFSARLGSNIEHYSSYLLTGVVVWNFFSAATSQSLNAVMGEATLIKSLPVNKRHIVLSVVLDVFFSHIFELLLLSVFLIYNGSLSVTALFFPILLAFQFIFTFGVGLMLSSLHFIFRDLGQVWSVLMRAWWFATPIFYMLHPGGPGEKVSMFNPMFYSIELSRDVLVYSRVPDLLLLGIFACFALVVYGVGSVIFNRISPKFAEYV